MKILERGSERIYRTECPSCRSRIEYEGKDTYNEIKNLNLEMSPTLMYIKRYIFCPVCHDRIEVV